MLYSLFLLLLFLSISTVRSFEDFAAMEMDMETTALPAEYDTDQNDNEAAMPGGMDKMGESMESFFEGGSFEEALEATSGDQAAEEPQNTELTQQESSEQQVEADGLIYADFRDMMVAGLQTMDRASMAEQEQEQGGMYPGTEHHFEMSADARATGSPPPPYEAGESSGDAMDLTVDESADLDHHGAYGLSGSTPEPATQALGQHGIAEAPAVPHGGYSGYGEHGNMPAQPYGFSDAVHEPATQAPGHNGIPAAPGVPYEYPDYGAHDYMPTHPYGTNGIPATAAVPHGYPSFGAHGYLPAHPFGTNGTPAAAALPYGHPGFGVHEHMLAQPYGNGPVTVNQQMHGGATSPNHAINVSGSNINSSQFNFGQTALNASGTSTPTPSTPVPPPPMSIQPQTMAMQMPGPPPNTSVNTNGHHGVAMRSPADVPNPKSNLRKRLPEDEEMHKRDRARMDEHTRKCLAERQAEQEHARLKDIAMNGTSVFPDPQWGWRFEQYQKGISAMGGLHAYIKSHAGCQQEVLLRLAWRHQPDRMKREQAPHKKMVREQACRDQAFQDQGLRDSQTAFREQPVSQQQYGFNHAPLASAPQMGPPFNTPPPPMVAPPANVHQMAAPFNGPPGLLAYPSPLSMASPPASALAHPQAFPPQQSPQRMMSMSPMPQEQPLQPRYLRLDRGPALLRRMQREHAYREPSLPNKTLPPSVKSDSEHLLMRRSHGQAPSFKQNQGQGGLMSPVVTPPSSSSQQQHALPGGIPAIKYQNAEFDPIKAWTNVDELCDE